MNISEIKALCMVWEAYTGRLPPHIQDYNTLFAEIDRLKAGLNAVQELINDSHGVVGLHLNGDVAPWDSLLEGGYYEDWLLAFSKAMEGG